MVATCTSWYEVMNRRSRALHGTYVSFNSTAYIYAFIVIVKSMCTLAKIYSRLPQWYLTTFSAIIGPNIVSSFTLISLV